MFNSAPALLMKVVTRNRFILPFIVFLTCLLITYINWNAANASRENELRSYFEYRARDINSRLEQRLTIYEQVLRSTRGLFDFSDNVSRTKFRTFFNAQRLDKNYPGIQGVGFSLIIPPALLKKNISSIRKEGFPNYKIWPEGKRESYTSIIYLEPFSNLNLRAFGYDMFSEPVRRKAMETARDSNEPVISGKVTLVQETGKAVQAGFLMYLPVYKNGSPHTTLSDRRKNIIGWVYSPFRMGDLIEGLFGEHASDLDIEIYDDNSISNKTRMFDSDDRTLRLSEQLTSKKEINLNGHEWTVFVKSTPQLNSRIGFNTARIILIVGLSLSLLLTIITWLLVNKRIRSIIANADRKHAEESLLNSEKRYRHLFEFAKDGILILDAESGKIVDANPFLKEMLGYSHEELLDKELWEIGTFKNIAESKKAFIELQDKGYIRFEDMPFNTKEGKHIEVEFVSNVYFVDNKKVIQCNIRDITDRKLAERNLKESEERFRSITQSANDAIITADSKGIILDWNKGAEKIFGYSESEVTGKELSIMIPPSYIDKHIKGVSRIEQGGEHHVVSKTVELYGLHKSGNEFPLELSLAEWETSQGRFFTGIIRDISRRKQDEEEINKSNELLTKHNAEKDKFFSIIAHDLKSPFIGFLNLTELMADSTEEFSTVQLVEYSKSLNQAAHNLYKLLENLLEWA